MPDSQVVDKFHSQLQRVIQLHKIKIYMLTMNDVKNKHIEH